MKFKIDKDFLKNFKKTSRSKVNIPDDMPDEVEFGPKEAEEELKKGYALAIRTLKDEDKLERLLQRMEAKFKKIPKIGDKISYIPTLISLVRSFVKKEYTDVPIGTIVAIISSITYFVNPIDVMPDVLPIIGHLDDVAVVAACLKLISADVKEYDEWRKRNGKKLDVD